MSDNILNNFITAIAFRKKLLNWHRTQDRKMPWKETNEAYKIWLSEIILQQTTVAQGMPYYLAFIKAYPTINHLADAPLDDVLRLWQGLGYYARARNMHTTAQYIRIHCNGIFPNSYDDIVALKGIGSYTAAAIASFAFGLPYAVVDGNVIRVLTRVFGITEPVTSLKVKKEIVQLATHLLDKNKPGAYNQAIMDFGALQCTPRQPVCTQCPFHAQCYAIKHGLVDTLPLKKVKPPKKHRYFHFIIFYDGSRLLLVQRQGNDIWKGLYTFPIVENNKQLSIKPLMKHITTPYFLPTRNAEPQLLATLQQELSHQRIYGLFYTIRVNKKDINRLKTAGYILLNKEVLRDKAMPKIMLAFLDKHYL